MTNQEIAGLLRNVAAAYAITDEKKYRFQIIAYQKASDAIEATTTEMSDLVKSGTLEGLPGIGPSIRAHIEELLKTGKVKRFEEVLKNIPESVFILLQVPSFGPKKAFKLVSVFHLDDPKTVIQDILKLAERGEIAKLEGFGEKSQEDIVQALTEFKAGVNKTSRMVLPYAFDLAEKVLSYLRKSPRVVQAETLGSLRRMKETIGDVDIAVATNHPDEVLTYFTKYPFTQRIIEKGPATSSILVSGGKHIDLMVQPPDGFGALLQHFTGSKHHNVALREYALKKELSLSERGIKHIKTEKLKKYKSEEEFYNALKMDWIPPEIRENTGEIQLALKKQLPKLVELEDIKGDLHIHSNYPIEPSHDLGRNSMQEMLQVAKANKYEYLGFSEHNPSISRHTSSQVLDLLSRRKDNIEHIKESNKSIRVISLLETDILPNGSLAINDKSLDLLDATLVSIHSSFGMNKTEMTKRIIQGLSHPKAKILSHPTGRLLNQRPGYDVDFDVLFDFVVKNNKALEINSWPERLDLPDTVVRDAIKNGVKFVIDTDSHASSHMQLMRFGVSVARRGWAKKDDILNTLPYNKFISWLRQ